VLLLSHKSLIIIIIIIKCYRRFIYVSESCNNAKYRNSIFTALGKFVILTFILSPFLNDYEIYDLRWQ